MCTISVEYKPTQEELEAHRELRDAVLEHSRKSMSHIIARYHQTEILR